MAAISWAFAVCWLLWAHLESWGRESPLPRGILKDARSPPQAWGKGGFWETTAESSRHVFWSLRDTVNWGDSCQKNPDGRRQAGQMASQCS